MANEDRHITRHWRGIRKDYEFLRNSNALSEWTRYSVIESDNSVTEYYGTHPITVHTGQLLPVDSIMKNAPSDPTPYSRYLVGNDESGYKIYEYHVQDKSNRLVPEITNFDDKYGVRVRDRGLMNFVYDSGRLVTYDEVDCGSF